MKIVIFIYRSQNPPSTFINQHIDNIAGGYNNFMQLFNWNTPMIGNNALWGVSLFSRIIRKIRIKLGNKISDFHVKAFKKGIKKVKADVVLAEFAYSGAHIWKVCKDLNIPLIVHTHGTDVNRRSIVDRYLTDYRKMFDYAKQLIAVSENDKRRLIEMGAESDKIHVIPCGAIFPSHYRKKIRNSGNFNIISVTRMAEKKAPHLIILSFYKYLELGGTGCLHMVGDGPLLPICKTLAISLKLLEKIIFYGNLSHEKVLHLYEKSHMYVQHSVIAEDGDCEGMPVSIMEAAGYGIPIVVTRHPGIDEIIDNNINGYLVDEYDIEKMAYFMHKIWLNKDHAEKLGKAAFELAKQKFDAKIQAGKVKEICVNACK